MDKTRETLRRIILFVAYRMVQYRQQERPWEEGAARFEDFTIELGMTPRRNFRQAIITHPKIEGRIVLIEANPEKVSDYPVPAHHKVMVYLESNQDRRRGASGRPGQVRYYKREHEVALAWMHGPGEFQEVLRLPVDEVVEFIEKGSAAVRT